jgi:hypothetical protein
LTVSVGVVPLWVLVDAELLDELASPEGELWVLVALDSWELRELSRLCKCSWAFALELGLSAASPLLALFCSRSWARARAVS